MKEIKNRKESGLHFEYSLVVFESDEDIDIDGLGEFDEFLDGVVVALSQMKLAHLLEPIRCGVLRSNKTKQKS